MDRWERTRDPSHFQQRTVLDWSELTNAAGFALIKHQLVPYELNFDWWVKQAGCKPETIQELQKQAQTAGEVVRGEMGLKFNASGSIESFVAPMLVARFELKG